MRRDIAIAALVGTAALLAAGCASMSEDECLVSDWRTVGYEDGAAGRTADRVGVHRKACAKHGVAPDLTAYREGREEGLREFCQPARGFNLGTSGTAYAGVCPPDLEDEFVAAYDSGRELYRLRSRVRQADAGIAAGEQELARIDQEMDRLEAQVLNDDAHFSERAQALVDAKELHERKGRLEEEIAQLKRDRVLHERELESYQTELAANH